jgi:hypothetical protein
VTGGDVTGGDVSGGDVSGGDVSGGDVTGGDVAGGLVEGAGAAAAVAGAAVVVAGACVAAGRVPVADELAVPARFPETARAPGAAVSPLGPVGVEETGRAGGSSPALHGVDLQPEQANGGALPETSLAPESFPDDKRRYAGYVMQHSPTISISEPTTSTLTGLNGSRASNSKSSIGLPINRRRDARPRSGSSWRRSRGR